MKYFLAIILIAVAYWFFSGPKTDAPGTTTIYTSTLGELTNPEKEYYEQVFSYAMAAIQPGKHYDWKSYSGGGKITVDKVFTSKSGATCRKFQETFIINNHEGKNEGVGCKREGRDGWCKLKSTDALTCAMEPSGNALSDAWRGATEAGGGVIDSVKGMISR